MDGFRRMLWVGRHHSADHIPVSALASSAVASAFVATEFSREPSSLKLTELMSSYSIGL